MNKDIPSYELCKKLKELGFINKYKLNIADLIDNKTVAEIHLDMVKNKERWPTISEMMDVLPYMIEDKRDTYWITIDKSSQLGYCVSYRSFTDLKYYRDKSLPNALAKILIWCIEEWYLDNNLLKDE